MSLILIIILILLLVGGCQCFHTPVAGVMVRRVFSA